jgi:hypothetical protein
MERTAGHQAWGIVGRTRALGWLAVLVAAGIATAWGQARGPHIGYLYPAGGQQGATFRVVIGGMILGGTDEAIISGGGVSASVVQYVRPLNNQELGDCRWFLDNMVRRRWNLTAMRYAARSEDPPELPDHPWMRNLDEKSHGELARLRARLFDPRRQPNAQIAELVEIEVTIDRTAVPGDRELRLATPGGLTNPMVFQVGTLPEVTEDSLAAPGQPPNPVVALPAVINGQIMPGEVDRFHVRARQGQQLVLRMQARRLVPYLADAVPGWFQPTLALYNPQGREVAFDDDYRFDPDPVLVYKVPADGVYDLEVRDSIYRGREDFVYRIAVGELPFITQAFPLGGPVGAATVATIGGWNLATDKLSLDTSPGGMSIRQTALTQPAGVSNPVSYVVGALPEAAETEPNDTAAAAQKVTLPVVINGRIGQPGDVDAFRFDGRAGEEVVAEVMARRLNSPMDAMLQLVDAAGKVVATNDDTVDPEMGLMTHHADSYVRFKLPLDGTYRVLLAEAQHQGGGAYGYRLRLGPPQPDFALRLTPSGAVLGPGRAATLTIHAVRKDGFAGDIEVALKDAPEGFTLAKATLPGDKDTAEMTLTAPRGMPRQAIALRFEGRAQIGGATVVRPVVPAEDMMQAFAYRHLVPQQEFLATIAGSRGGGVPAVWRPLLPGVTVADAGPLRLPVGGMAQVRLQAPVTLPDALHSPLRAVRFELGSRVRGISLRDTTPTPTGVTLTFKADSILAEGGYKGNLLVVASVVPPGAESKSGRPQPISIGVLPAIPFEVVWP